jgi:hypothetical protein
MGVVFFLTKEVYVNEQLSSRRIMEVLDSNPDLEKIMCPISIYTRISKKYMDALDELGIELEPVQRRGRPKKYSPSDATQIQKMLDKGESPKEISQKLNLPVKTVYYLKNSSLKRGRKVKYTSEKAREVKKLYGKGIPAKKISENLKIPLRTVYFLIKR